MVATTTAPTPTSSKLAYATWLSTIHFKKGDKVRRSKDGMVYTVNDIQEIHYMCNKGGDGSLLPIQVIGFMGQYWCSPGELELVP